MPRPDDKETLRRVRDIALYLLSVTSVSHALLGWEGGFLSSVAAHVAWAVALGCATASAELVSPYLAAVDEVPRDRLRFFVALVYLGMAVPGLLLTALQPNPVLGRLLVPALAAAQLPLLALTGLDRSRRGPVANAAVLALFACLPGGPLAAAAAVSLVGLLGVFLVAEHWYGTLSSYPAGEGLWTPRALREAAVSVGPVVAGLACYLYFQAADPMGGGAFRLRATRAPLEVRSMSMVLLCWIAGASALYLAGRMLIRGSSRDPAAIEVPDPLRGGVERLEPGPPPPAVRAGRGLRGRVVRAYLQFLEAAGAAGLTRPPGTTAREFATTVALPAGPLSALTEAFAAARYGQKEPTIADAEHAEACARRLREGIERKAPSPLP
jgi:hypothetical protein